VHNQTLLEIFNLRLLHSWSRQICLEVCRVEMQFSFVSKQHSMQNHRLME